MSDLLIYAGIVSYNPDIERLQENLSSICKQISQVIIVDNGSENQIEVQKLALNFDNVSVIGFDSNKGIAAALNQLMDFGLKHSYLWMLTLDQDSVCGLKYLERMLPYLSVEKNLGIVAPVIMDRNVGVVGHYPIEKYACVNTCISSGAFVNVKIWDEVGRYDESMFIDSVDFEFCYRIRKNGYKVIQVKSVQLLHEIGKSEHKKFLFWNVIINGHSAFRKFYIARNNVYYPLKHRLIFHLVRGNFRNLWMIIIILLYEDDKRTKIREVLRGWRAAYRREPNAN